ncbi:glycosyltransferase family 1 protein [Brachybacterium hainanense]|uniref:Glycosyltransferase family 1 protein n=1 Tax=Brachybacterium hainanense TaxID=1541174 RepID=A0ABV6RDH1_9MICO
MDSPSPSSRARVLILCFSPLERDARVLRQIDTLSADFAVTTCGYGPPPRAGIEHVRLPDGLTAWKLDRPLVIARRFRRAYWKQESVVAAWKALQGREFDVILADDVETVPLALALRPKAGVHADLHEYSPRLKEDLLPWRLFVAPYIRWICRTAVAAATSVTTVSEGLAREYEREFGFRTDVLTNAAPYQDRRPAPVQSPVRMVHSGAAMPKRQLEVMIEAAMAVERDAPGSVVFDLYLTPNHPAYVQELRELAAGSAGAVRVLDPVPHADLPAALAAYDVGLFACPDTTFSLEHALPNKFFDYVQARLAIAISPSPEMVALLERHDLGVRSAQMSASSFADALRSLTPERIAHFKQSADRAARALSSEEEMPKLTAIVRRILEGAA